MACRLIHIYLQVINFLKCSILYSCVFSKTTKQVNLQYFLMNLRFFRTLVKLIIISYMEIKFISWKRGELKFNQIYF
jgi:hypothetical protein